jgi:hypothetical protein
MALPTLRARPPRGSSSSMESRCMRMSMTATVGQAGAYEQGRDYRVRPFLYIGRTAARKSRSASAERLRISAFARSSQDLATGR